MIGNKEVLNISVEDIIPNRFQPRLAFDEVKLNELSDSIKQHGVLQPLLLRKIGDKFEIIAGERRYKASCIAGLNNVPAIIVETDDNTSAEIAITENIQRKDLTAIEEAESYRKLLNKGHTQETIAKKLGIAQSTVANKLRLLALSEEVRDALLNNKISERHARGLLRISDKTKQVELLNRIISERLTVKQTDEEIDKLLDINSPSLEKLDIEIPDFEIKEENQIETFDVPREEILEIKEIDEVEEPAEKELPEILSPFSETLFEEVKEEEPVKFSQNKYLTALNKARDFTRNLEDDGYKLTTEEFDLGNIYQIVIKINKDE